MGTFSSAIHIKLNPEGKREQFQNQFAQYMKSKDLILTDKADSQLVYYLVFSNNGNWVTLASPHFAPGNGSAIKETPNIAKEFKTFCVETSVYDSDWAMINLYNSSDKPIDTVVIGDAEEFLGEESITQKGNQECWTPLIADGKAWGELSQIWNSDYVFTEDGLCASASFLDMDLENMTADWKDIEGKQDNPNVVTMYFKSSAEPFIKDGPTKLTFGIMSVPISGKDAYYAFCNIGGVSKGLAVVLLGDCIKNHEVEITDFKIRRNKNPLKARQYAKAKGGWIPMTPDLEGGNEEELFYADLEEFHSLDDRDGLIAKFDDYEFFEGVNVTHPTMQGSEGHDIKWYYESDIWFKATILSGAQHKFSLHIIPTNYPENQLSCFITVTDFSKLAKSKLKGTD